MKYRADIEGLRGVAILLVVLAHAQLPGWAGGFIGVDVFFVMSGYLITGLLTTELQRRGEVDYWAFFARRARRLAPAMLLMVVVVSVVCVATLPAQTLQLQLDSGRWAALWLSNVYFSFARFDYFGTAAQDSLFLHTWSLGVEEQFYLLWPVLVVWAWRRRQSGRAWLGLMIGISLAISLLLMPVDATSAYYLMPARLWQLALGGLVYRLFDGEAGAALRAHSNLLGVGGAVMLTASLLLIDETVAYPGFWALLPALAAAALLAAGTGSRNVVGGILASPLLAFTGRISYSWYLWHWPLLMMGPVLGLWPLGGLESLALILASFLVGCLSYALVEQPLRRGASGTPRSVVLVSVLASLILFALLHITASLTKPKPDGSQSFEQRVQSLITIPAVYGDDRCDQWYHSAELVPCEVVAGQGDSGLMLLVGDSIGTHWLPALQQAAAMRGMRLVVLTKSSCPIVDEPFVYARIHRRFTECEEWREAVVAYVQATRPDMVVMGSATAYGFTTVQWTQGSLRILDQMGEGLRTIVVLAPTPTLPFHGPGCVMAEGKESSAGIEVGVSACKTDLSSAENREVIQALREATDASTGSHLLYLNDLVCPDGSCRALMDGNLVYRDQQHLNATFAESLGGLVESRLPGTVAAPTDR